MKKRRVLACAVLAAGLSLGGYGTYAYFTADVTVTNVITSGNVEIALHETMKPENGEEEVPFEDQTGVMPGRKVSKIVRVENTGGQPAYIRVRAEKKIILAEGISGDPDVSLVSCDFNRDAWTEKDGYFYYHDPLQPGEFTEPLFTHVTFDRDMGNMYQDSRAEITVSAQAVQQVNNDHSASNAQGWPEDKN
ncbi:MAG: SipW-dependent-type signal peptide-containing protein [Eubacteriales bacterium]|nr:SipW-dependent-type signal peptide-containing protein [Eubacteriales bacterium]